MQKQKPKTDIEKARELYLIDEKKWTDSSMKDKDSKWLHTMKNKGTLQDKL